MKGNRDYTQVYDAVKYLYNINLFICFSDLKMKDSSQLAAKGILRNGKKSAYKNK